MSLFFIDSSRQALILMDPQKGGIGFAIPEIEKADYWEPKGKLEVSLRAALPKMPGQSQIVQAAALPPGMPRVGRR